MKEKIQAAIYKARWIDGIKDGSMITDEALTNAVLAVVEAEILEKQARAWDKGWAKGARGNGITPMRIGYIYPPTKSNRNPYRYQQEREAE